jgi:radical SAM superfamily enzyme YgiQ (UPF0313 family)
MKLGLIAMSGLRAQNEELTRMGLTLPGFMERSKVIASLPSLGLLTLAGMTPVDVDIDYVEVEDLKNIDGLPGEFDVAAISSFTAQIKDAYTLADRYRSAGTITLLGGLHVTARPDEALQHADCIVIGEGEPMWPQVINDLKRKRLRKIYDSRDLPFDLAHSPMPRFELLNLDDYNRLTVQTARGCPFNCEFCAASVRLSPIYRVKPVPKVISEIRYIKDLWKQPFIEFADDNSFVNRKHSKNLLRALIPEKIRWFTETDISIARDSELLALMRDSGCAQVLIGLESTSLAGLKGLEKRSDWKAKQFDFYHTAIDKIQSYGIGVNGCFVLGLDGTGIDSFQEVFEFVRESGLSDVQITVQTAFPGTPLYHRLKRSGRLLNEKAWELCTLFDVNFQPDGMSEAELEHNFRLLAQKIYSEKSTKERRRRFHLQVRKAIKYRHLHSAVPHEFKTAVDS